MMKNNQWIKGALLLGVSFFIAILLVKPIGVSTEFSVLSGRIHYMLNPSIISEDDTRESGYKSMNAYYDKSGGKIAQQIINPINYSMMFVLAIPIGAFIGYKTSKKSKKQGQVALCHINDEDREEADAAQNKRSVNPDVMLCNNGNKGVLKRYLSMFIGGFLLLFGARFAGGCTSGHMMSGMMQSSVSGYVFAGVVFAVAIPTAIITKKIRMHRG